MGILDENAKTSETHKFKALPSQMGQVKHGTMSTRSTQVRVPNKDTKQVSTTTF